MEKIIVVGYPKSGTTWLSRLTASLVNCPVDGFLYSNHNEIAIEGQDRKSIYRIYKSHHQLHELSKNDIKSSKIIYIIRDPRDISISGRSYFRFGKPIFNTDSFSNKGIYSSFVNYFKIKINTINFKISKILFAKTEMNKAVLFGNMNVHNWCKVSWIKHIVPYQKNAKILKVQYESLLCDTFKESKRILEFLDIKRTDYQINKCIYKQSFKNKKTQFLKSKEIWKSNFLRKGQKEQWKSVFSARENILFLNHLKSKLIELSYNVEIKK